MATIVALCCYRVSVVAKCCYRVRSAVGSMTSQWARNVIHLKLQRTRNGMFPHGEAEPKGMS